MIRSTLIATAVLAALPGAAIAEAALPVEIVTVQARPRAVESRLVGTIVAANSYPGAFRAGGRIVDIPVDTGDRVPAGMVLARIDAAQADAALAGARAGLDAAAAALRQAELGRDRASGMLDRGVGTQSQLDAAEEAWLGARAGRNQAAARLASAEQAVEDTLIRADEDLVVLNRHAEPGEIVGAGQEVLTLATAGRLEALFLSPDLDGLAELRHMPVALIADGLPPIRSEITEISPLLTRTGTVEVRAAIPSDLADRLTIGDTVEGQVSTETAPLFTVPWTALAATRDGPAVWTVDPDSMAAHLTRIEIASYHDFSIDVSAGLADGAMVVGAGSQALYEGVIVAPSEGSE